MKRNTICAILFLIFCYTTASAKTVTFKGEVQDELGRAVNSVMILVKDLAVPFSDNKFEIETDENDTLHFQLSGEIKKDTTLANPDVYHIIKVKLSTNESGVSDGTYEPLPPSFVDNTFPMEKFIKGNIQYPEDAVKKKVSGVAHVRFTMDGRGKINNFSVKPSLYPSLDLEAVRLVRLLPQMLPAIKNNRYSVSNCFIPIRFNLQEYLAKTDSTIEIEPIYEKVATMPQFKGGMREIEAFIKKNLIYPENYNLKENTKVMVSFIVNKKGKVEDVTIIQSIAPPLDEEAIKVISKLPKFKPGLKNGEKVAVRIELPIWFILRL